MATERFTFKNQKEKANACGTCFEGAGSNSLPFSASISLCSLCPLWLNNFRIFNSAFRHPQFTLHPRPGIAQKKPLSPGFPDDPAKRTA